MCTSPMHLPNAVSLTEELWLTLQIKPLDVDTLFVAFVSLSCYNLLLHS